MATRDGKVTTKEAHAVKKGHIIRILLDAGKIVRVDKGTYILKEAIKNDEV